MNDYQLKLIEHLQELPTTLHSDLVEATVDNGEVLLNGGDFSIARKPKSELRYANLDSTTCESEEAILLITPNVRFAYDPSTGEEITNSMARYNVTNRTDLLKRWRGALILDSCYLRSRGLDGLADAQDKFLEKL